MGLLLAVGELLVLIREEMSMHIPDRFRIRTAFTALAAIAFMVSVGTGCSQSSSSSSSGGGGNPPGPSDSTPPTILSVSPPDNATNVPVSAQLQVAFSEAMQSASINGTTFTVGGVTGAVSVSISGTTASYSPTTSLLPNTTYSVTIHGGTNGVKDLAGNALAIDKTWSFTTASAPTDAVAPTVTTVYPPEGATNISTSVRPMAGFSEPLQPISVTASTFSMSGVSTNASLSGSGAMAWLSPLSPDSLLPNTTYTVTVLGGTNGVKDLAGNFLAADKNWSFTTGGSYPCDGFYASGFQLVEGIDRTVKPSVPVPTKGIRFADPTYGTCVVRVTNANTEIPLPYSNSFARVDYSRREAFNADDSLILVYAYDGTWHIYDARTLQYVRKLSGPGGDAEPQWHPTDPNILYYLPNNGGLTISQVNVQTGVSSVVANFSGRLPWPNAARVWTESEGSPSADGCYWGFLVQDSNFNFLGLLTYNLCTDTILGTTASIPGFDSTHYAPNNVSMSPSGKYIVAQYAFPDHPLGANQPGGPIAFTADFQSYRHLRPNGQTAHTDIAIGANGHDVFVADDEGDAVDSGYVYMVDLDTGITTNLFLFWTTPSSYFAGHISGKAFRRPGWVVVSEFGGEYYGENDWFNNRIYLVELAPNPRVYYLSHHHTVFASTNSGEDDYFSQVHASPNRDLTKIVFNSNWDRAGLQYVDTYMIEIPPGAIP